MSERKLRVLVVDDHPLSGQIVARLLVRRGFHVALAVDGVDALNWLAEEPFDAVVSDVEMPVMDGFELLQQIHLRHPTVPVILMTAFFDDEKQETARAWGAAGILKKPFGSEELVVAITLAMRSAPSGARKLASATATDKGVTVNFILENAHAA
jgi:DNA-binding response OmpR family regulator